MDGDVYTDQQLEENYQQLIKKYREWKINGEKGSFIQIRLIDYSNVFFSKLTITYLIICLVMLIGSIVLGKIVFPQLTKLYENTNKELVDITSLRTAEQVNEIAGKTEKNKKAKKEWF